MLEIALASQSPRRRELLQNAGFLFRVFPVKVSEIFDENLNPEAAVQQIASVKLLAAVKEHKELKTQGFLVLSADTVVVCDDRVLGKPQNTAQAREFLRLLSGRAHSVMTAISLWASGPGNSPPNIWSALERTEVRFRSLSDQEIDTYVATGEPMDKAGAYAIQGGGGNFVSSYSGSWSNVVGLPMERLESALKENGWSVRRRTPTHN